MLNNDTYEILLMTKMKIDELHATADQVRMASLAKKRETVKHSKAVTSILHGTGKALINTGLYRIFLTKYNNCYTLI